MHIAIRTIGNSKGILLPKPLLAQAGLEGETIAEVAVEKNAIVLRKPIKAIRSGWAEAAKEIGHKGDDELLMGEFGNADDGELVW